MYEYKRIQGSRDDPFDGLENQMNILARSGWELHTTTEGNGNERYATLVRLVKESECHPEPTLIQTIQLDSPKLDSSSSFKRSKTSEQNSKK
jgi:hypothetical protein